MAGKGLGDEKKSANTKHSLFLAKRVNNTKKAIAIIEKSGRLSLFVITLGLDKNLPETGSLWDEDSFIIGVALSLSINT